ncbi:MAG: glycosyltransferase family 4 protein [Candidatus Omnitrophica bacterium]|nr:glycosyltransferase family 4 protein [Candidatus Omnitrophota bacterium]
MKILILNQSFYPDVAAVGQYAADLAVDLASRGHDVSVITGRHGYNDPSKKFSPCEIYRGVRIHRVLYSSFGKKSRWGRTVDIVSFLFGVFRKLLFFPRQDVVVGMTSPPLIAVMGCLFCVLKGGRSVDWVMDLNPDQAVIARWLKEGSLAHLFLKWISGWAFRKSGKVVVLDRWMKDRIEERYHVPGHKIAVIAPWAHDDVLAPIPHDKNPLRQQQSWNGKFVVMYSGNQSACHPLDTLLRAAQRFREDPRVVFCFVGEGALSSHVRDFKESCGLSGISQFPDQPPDVFSQFQAAADVHIVVMGEGFVGVVHPSKVYGVLAVGRPFIYIGPEDSSLGEMVRIQRLGFRVDHGDVEGLVRAIEQVRSFDEKHKEDIADRSVRLKSTQYSQRALSGEFVSVIANMSKTP